MASYFLRDYHGLTEPSRYSFRTLAQSENNSTFDTSVINTKEDFLRSMQLQMKRPNYVHDRVDEGHKRRRLNIPSGVKLRKCHVVIVAVKCEICGQCFKCITDLNVHKNLRHVIYSDSANNQYKEFQNLEKTTELCEVHREQFNCGGAVETGALKSHRSKRTKIYLTIKIGEEIFSRRPVKRKHLKSCMIERSTQTENESFDTSIVRKDNDRNTMFTDDYHISDGNLRKHADDDNIRRETRLKCDGHAAANGAEGAANLNPVYSNASTNSDISALTQRSFISSAKLIRTPIVIDLDESDDSSATMSAEQQNSPKNKPSQTDATLLNKNLSVPSHELVSTPIVIDLDENDNSSATMSAEQQHSAKNQPSQTDASLLNENSSVLSHKPVSTPIVIDLDENDNSSAIMSAKQQHSAKNQPSQADARLLNENSSVLSHKPVSTPIVIDLDEIESSSATSSMEQQSASNNPSHRDASLLSKNSTVHSDRMTNSPIVTKTYDNNCSSGTTSRQQNDRLPSTNDTARKVSPRHPRNSPVSPNDTHRQKPMNTLSTQTLECNTSLRATPNPMDSPSAHIIGLNRCQTTPDKSQTITSSKVQPIVAERVRVIVPNKDFNKHSTTLTERPSMKSSTQTTEFPVTVTKNTSNKVQEVLQASTGDNRVTEVNERSPDYPMGQMSVLDVIEAMKSMEQKGGHLWENGTGNFSGIFLVKKKKNNVSNNTEKNMSGTQTSKVTEETNLSQFTRSMLKAQKPDQSKAQNPSYTLTASKENILACNGNFNISPEELKSYGINYCDESPTGNNNKNNNNSVKIREAVHQNYSSLCFGETERAHNFF